MAIRHFTDLIAWQKAMDACEATYAITEAFPQREMYGLSQQMRRAAVSIPSNIAEGQGRSTTKDFVHFLHISKGSLQELYTQVILSCRLKFITPADQEAFAERFREIERILNGLINSLST
jgi:four helix bundle protein